MTNGNQAGSAQGESAADADAFNAFEAAGWERQASTYAGFLGGITSRLVEPLLDAAGVGPGTRVLEIGSGPGYAAARAAERGASVVGVDVAAAMVALARDLHPGLDFRRADAEALPFDDGAFDAAVGNFVVLHLGRPKRAVRELTRVLGPGGRVALTVWDLPDRMRLLGVLLDAIAEAGAVAPPDIPVGPPFFQYAVDEQFEALLESGGLSGVEVSTVAFGAQVSDAGELWDGLLSGTVRTSPLILRQPEATRREIREAFERLVLAYRHGDRFEVPVSVKLAVGRKAA